MKKKRAETPKEPPGVAAKARIDWSIARRIIDNAHTFKPDGNDSLTQRLCAGTTPK